MFDTRRDLAAHGRPGLAERCDPALSTVINDFVTDHYPRHGWTRHSAQATAIGIRILHGLQDDPEAPIKASDTGLLQAIELPIPRVLEILAAMGHLQDDRAAAGETWFTAKTLGLPETIREELGIWFLVMRDGSTTPPRRKPRAEGSINTQFRSALPAIQTWVTNGTTSLRQITRDDVIAVLPTDRNARAGCGRQGSEIDIRDPQATEDRLHRSAARVATGFPQPDHRCRRTLPC